MECRAEPILEARHEPNKTSRGRGGDAGPDLPAARPLPHHCKGGRALWRRDAAPSNGGPPVLTTPATSHASLHHSTGETVKFWAEEALVAWERAVVKTAATGCGPKVRATIPVSPN